MPTEVSLEELSQMVGRERAPSSWFEVDQARVDLFAEATEDHQYIHVDPEKAARTPFGSTVAHGYLTLSLLPRLSEEISVIPEGMVMGINYGLNKLRFPQPVKVGSKIRLHSKIVEVTDKGGGRHLVTSQASIEIDGEEKPALVAETLVMYVVA